MKSSFLGSDVRTGNYGRRDFLKISAGAAGTLGALTLCSSFAQTGGTHDDAGENAHPDAGTKRRYFGDYKGANLSRVAFPMGGIGAGMFCLEGTGALSQFSLRHRPDVYNEPAIFAAVCVRSPKTVARVLEGPVPKWRMFGRPGAAHGYNAATAGLPRFREASFKGRFPFGEVSLNDDALPLVVRLTGWSPFEPGDADNSSLPVAALEYHFTNRSSQPVEAVFSFNAKNLMTVGESPGDIRSIPGGFILHQNGSAERPWDEGSFAVTVDEPGTKVNHAWFRGGWWDPMTRLWAEIAEGACYDRPPVTDAPATTGASLFVPFNLAPGASRVIAVRLSWYVPKSDVSYGKDRPGTPALPVQTYQPWYAGRFRNPVEVDAYWRSNYGELRGKAGRFSQCFHGSTLPAEVLEAVSSNLAILKSPTVLRQTDGRFWAWEGCFDAEGSCAGSCTHVWNYAQAIPHLFPTLERSVRESEYGAALDEHGMQVFRTGLPIRPIIPEAANAADGQLGSIIRVYRDWRICGDTAWVRALWPKVRLSLDYCIETWDPRRLGWLEEPQSNTYDIEFWGPNGMCTSIYLGALKAAILMGKALGEDVGNYPDLLASGIRRLEGELFNGDYFIQRVEWKNLRAKLPETPNLWNTPIYSAEAKEVINKEGPNYQYGNGCLSDGVIGDWFAQICGVGQVIDAKKVTSHLKAVYRHNFRRDFSEHANPQRPTYACSDEGGLLLCTWPNGGRPSIPFVYSDEVWTGIEYQVASHLMMMGMVEEGLEIVRTCRDRYDGRVRNPFDEYEAGHWYARALASYALMEGLTGARYDAVEQVLHLKPNIAGDFRSFLSTATGYGSVGVRDGKPFLDVVAGSIEVREIKYTAKL